VAIARHYAKSRTPQAAGQDPRPEQDEAQAAAVGKRASTRTPTAFEQKPGIESPGVARSVAILTCAITERFVARELEREGREVEGYVEAATAEVTRRLDAVRAQIDALEAILARRG
jgi:hypothetical protein